MSNKSMRTILAILLILFLPDISLCQKLPKNYGKLEAKLFSSESSKKSLIVAFGGSEGGNTFASKSTRDVREDFLDRGFHFLAINYFGTKGLPKTIDRISLDAIYDTISNTSDKLDISYDNIILLGASRGGELVLNLASHFKFQGVIALVPSNVTVPYLQKKNAASSWTMNNKPIEFIAIDENTLKKEGWSKAIEKFLDNKKESSTGLIQVENIKGFVLLTSGKSDEAWPSYRMCNEMVNRMERNNFKFPFSHIAFEGGHNASTHWSEIFAFLDEQLIDMYDK